MILKLPRKLINTCPDLHHRQAKGISDDKLWSSSLSSAQCKVAACHREQQPVGRCYLDSSAVPSIEPESRKGVHKNFTLEVKNTASIKEAPNRLSNYRR